MFVARYKALIQTLQLLVNDLTSQLEKEREEHRRREAALLDRIMALTNPVALAATRPRPPSGQTTARPFEDQRLHWPAEDFPTEFPPLESIEGHRK